MLKFCNFVVSCALKHFVPSPFSFFFLSGNYSTVIRYIKYHPGRFPFVERTQLFRWEIKWNGIFHGKFLEKRNTFSGITGKTLYHLFHSTSTMLYDEIRGLSQPSVLLHIVEPRLSKKKNHAQKGTSSSILFEEKSNGKFLPVFPYKWKAPPD